MGCTYSTVEVDEVLGRCKERRRLMKQLMKCRADLAAALIAYLRSLRNTGNTLRQLIEVESMTSGVVSPIGPTSPPSPSPPPPPSLPPSPPSPPNFFRVGPKESTKAKFYVADPSDMDEDDDEGFLLPPPPPPFSVSSGDFGDHMGSTASSGSSSPLRRAGDAAHASVENNWAEPKSEFDGEGEVVEEDEEDDLIQRKEALAVAMNRARATPPSKELVDDNLSTVSQLAKDTDPTATAWRSKKTWAGIAKELDEYFLKAAGSGKDVVVLLESSGSDLHHGHPKARKGKSFKSAKVVHVLSWSWSFRSHSNRDTQDVNTSSMPSTHCTTLEKILVEEQKLYSQVKDEENIKSQHKKTLLFLDKLQGGDYDWLKTERTLSDVEELQCQIISIKESINETCLSISKLRDEELFPQLLEFCGGLVKTWRTMYECHQVQNHVSQQANHLDNSLATYPTTDSHHQAISQLVAEVTSWHSSFCNLFRCQREYIRVLRQWVTMTDCLPETNLMGSSSSIHNFCDEVQEVLDQLPDKVAAEAINSFLLVLRSIIRQHTEEHSLQKRFKRFQIRLEKEMISSQALEKDNQQTRLEALKRKAEEEKVKYLHSVRTSRAMVLNNLQTSLPNVFQSLMGFLSTCTQALADIINPMGAVATLPQRGSPVH